MKSSKETLKILLVDDETIVLDVTTAILKSMGYKVTAISSSVTALEMFKTDPEQFDLVISDMMMPHMSGDKLAKEIMEIRYGKPVILYTGYNNQMTKEKAEEMGIREFVMKPFTRKDLSDAISKVISEKQNHNS